MRKLILGLTGSFGTGKTTVAEMFKGHGARVIDADALCRKLMQPGQVAYKGIVSEFGKDILKKDNSIDRSRLSKLVFVSPSKLKKLNKLVHPYVIKKTKALAAKSSKKVVIIDAPLLIEAGLDNFVDALVVVKTSSAVQIKRCLRKGFSAPEARRRIRCQLPLAKKTKLADFIIDNSGKRGKTAKQVKRIWEEIKDGHN